MSRPITQQDHQTIARMSRKPLATARAIAIYLKLDEVAVAAHLKAISLAADRNAKRRAQHARAIGMLGPLPEVWMASHQPVIAPPKTFAVEVKQ